MKKQKNGKVLLKVSASILAICLICLVSTDWFNVEVSKMMNDIFLIGIGVSLPTTLMCLDE